MESNKFNINFLSEENVKKNVLPIYNLENAKITKIKFKDSDKQRAVYKVDYINTSYCLKKVYFSINDLLFVYSAIEWFFRNGINVPRILPTKEKSRFVNYKNMLFILTPWVNGLKCDYDNTNHMISSISNLALMHKVSTNFIPINGSSNRNGFENLYYSTSKHLKQLLLCSNLAFKYKDTFSNIFLQYFSQNIELCQTAEKIASTINTKMLNKALCHSDYVNKNIIVDESNKIWVIDFDKCKMDYAVHDISYFLRRFLKRDNTQWDIKTAIDTLNNYESIKSLNINEYKAILVYLAFPQKYWKISKDYYNNINKCNKNSFIVLMKKANEQNESHIQFVNEMIKYLEDKFNEKLL
ncbi:MAG: CotS family spore coat protein [Bacillota bacterium]|nr:CotS family spore coat protein [Bacillota bacterium]